MARELFLFFFFALLAIALTWPLASHLGTAVSDLGDPLLNTWILDWDLHALTHAPLSLYQAPIFHPAHLPLAYSENLIGIALLMPPFLPLGLAPIAIYNLAMLLGFALCGYGACVLARVVTGSLAASIVAGIFFAFVSYRFDHLAHLQIVWSGWLPLMLAALLVYWRTPTKRHAAMLAVAFAMNGLTNVHWLLFGSFALVATIALLATAAAPRPGLRFWLPLGASLAIGGLTLLPVLIPYRIVAKEYGMQRSREEVRDGSGSWHDWLMATPRSALYARFSDPELSRHEHRLFPGLLPLFFLGCAIALTPAGRASIDEQRQKKKAIPLWPIDAAIVTLAVLSYLGAASRELAAHVHGHTLFRIDSSDIPLTLLVALVFVRLSVHLPRALGGDQGLSLRDRFERSRFSYEVWTAALWIVIGVLGSLGLNAFLHTFLFNHVEAFRSLRMPVRWSMIAYTGLSVWVALGVAALLERCTYKRAAGAMLIVLSIAEVSPRIRWENALPDVAPVDRWIAATHPGPVLHLPMSGYGVAFLYLLGATAHHQPILNGTSGFEPPLHAQLRVAGEQQIFDDRYTATLERNGCAMVVVHVDWLGEQAKATLAWMQRETSSGRLVFLRRFEHGVRGDYVFAVARVATNWQRLRVDQDTASLAALLAGREVYNASTFGRVDLPRHYSEHSGPLHVEGWALSPSGITGVDVLMQGGRVRIPASLCERPDVVSRFPWYPRTPKPGFVLELPKRPKGVARDTDVQVEIRDGLGGVTTMPDVLIHWN